MQGVPGLGFEFDASAHRAFGSRACSHQPAFFARFFGGAVSAPRLPARLLRLTLAALPLDAPAQRIHQIDNVRRTAAGFSFGAGNPACFERMSSIIAFS